MAARATKAGSAAVVWIGEAIKNYSPWKIAISGDDKVYIDDFSGDGVVYAFDQTIATNNYLMAIRADNYPAQDTWPELSGLAVTGTGTNTRIWMTDENPFNSAGIIVWSAATNGVAALDDPGMIVAPIETNYLTKAPYDLSLDTNGEIYTIQFLETNDAPAIPVMSFPAYGGIPETNVLWQTGFGYPSLLDAYGIAVNPSATLVAVALVGTCPDTELSPCGGLDLFLATNGTLVTNLASLDTNDGDAYYDVAWDKVGNLYALDGTAQVWRAYSPPGSNSATTVSVPFIQAYPGLLPPSLLEPRVGTNSFHFTLAGQSNVTYVLQGSCDLSNWSAMFTNYSINANRHIFVPLSCSNNFYRAVAVP